jgi:uncharacterized damage-inducible protein DinB
MRIKMTFATAVLGLCTMGAAAQMGKAPSLGAVGAQADPAKAINVLLTIFEHEAMGVAKTMPADKYSFAPTHATFAPTQGEKFDGVRTFGQQVAHVAQANYYFFSTISGVKPDVDMAKMEKATTKEEAVAALAGSFAFGHKAIATITAENAFTVIKGADGLDTRATLATFAVAHGYDHYGQMVEYLRMNGLTPPASAK